MFESIVCEFVYVYLRVCYRGVNSIITSIYTSGDCLNRNLNPLLLKKLSAQVKDICNELDVRSLCHKILQNVSILLKADRGSLFLVEGRCNSANSDTPNK